MSRRHDLDHHRRSLNEIREVMNAMKTLAFMETRKLAPIIEAQQAMVDNIETVATDFLSFQEHTLPEAETDISVYLLIGTERGFCGDINQSLLNQFETSLQHIASSKAPQSDTSQTNSSRMIVVGHKLHLLLENDRRVNAFINGASLAEEVDIVLQKVVEELVNLQSQFGALSLYGIYHHGEDGIAMNRLLPPFQALKQKQPPYRPYSHPPVLNLSPAKFLLELSDHYLFAALNEMFYTSLMAENHRRVAQLDGAVQHLDEESEQLLRQSNALRQEEITEEIEVILLSADSLTVNVKSGKTYKLPE